MCTLPVQLLSLLFSCFQSSFGNRVMISCSIHGIDELYSCKESLPYLSFLVENPLMVFEYRPIYGSEASAVKAMRPILTREFSFQLILGFCTLPFSQYWEYNIPNTLLSLLHCDVYHGVEVGILEDENLKGKFSARLSSWNHSPNFVFSKDSFFFCNLTLFSDVLTWDCCCRRCCRCCFSRKPSFSRIVEATVSRCTLEDSSSFQRCSNLVSLTRNIPR